MIKLHMFSFYFAYTIIINLKGKLQKPFDFFLRYALFWLAHLLVEIPGDFELLRSIQLIIDRSNMLKPYMEVLNLLVLHVPPENIQCEKNG